MIHKMEVKKRTKMREINLLISGGIYIGVNPCLFGLTINLRPARTRVGLFWFNTLYKGVFLLISLCKTY